MCELWDYVGEDCHIGYGNIRDARGGESGRWCQGIRQHVSEMWERFKPYADDHFVQEFPRSPDQRYFEMYLGCCLLNKGFTLNKRKSGPDFFLEAGGKKIWIEAVTPTSGQEGSPDRVPDIIADGRVQKVPVEQVIIRFIAALRDKEQKFKGYTEKGIVGKNDIKVIALSSGALQGRTMSGVYPHILSAVFPLGDAYLTLERGTGKVIGQGNHYRPSIAKSNGAEVEALLFADPVHADISAVVYSEANIGNPISQFGRDLLVIHNPLATSPLPHGLLPYGREYWAEDAGDTWALKNKEFIEAE